MRRSTFYVLTLMALSQAHVAAQQAVETSAEKTEKATAALPGAKAGSTVPDTRTDLWISLKRGKVAELKPYKVGKIENLFLKLEGSFLADQDKGYSGISPFVGTISSGSGTAMGIQARRQGTRLLPVDAAVSAAYSTRGYQSYELQLGKLTTRETTFTVNPVGERLVTEFTERKPAIPGVAYYVDLHYNHFPQEDFYGIGPGSRRENRADYRMNSASVEGVVGFQCTKRLGTSLRAGLVRFDVGPGSDEAFPDMAAKFSEFSAPGLLTEPDYLRLTGALVFDYRDAPQDAHRGGMIGFLASNYNDRGGNFSEFTRLALDARHYIPLASEYRTLALRFVTSFDRVSRGNIVPFYLQESLGGINSLRGYSDFRFRDRNLLLASAEYRWDPAEFLQMVLFYDTGKVFSETSQFDFSNLEKGYGAGVRIKRGKSVFVRVEFGHSREGNLVHFKLGPSF